MRFISSAVVVLALGLVACGPSGNSVSLPGGGSVSTANTGDGSVTTVKGANGEVVQFGNNGAAASASLPDFLPLFPGAKVTANITAPDNSNDRKTGSVAFNTNASMADVMAFYKQKAVAAGLEESLNMATGDSSTYMASKDKMMLQVIASKGTDAATDVLLSWTAPK